MQHIFTVKCVIVAPRPNDTVQIKAIESETFECFEECKRRVDTLFKYSRCSEVRVYLNGENYCHYCHCWHRRNK